MGMKYRYRVLNDNVGLRVRDLARPTCEHLEIEILRGVLSQYHVTCSFQLRPIYRRQK